MSSKLYLLLAIGFIAFQNVNAQTNPSPHNLKNGDYVFTNFFANPTTTYPPSMQGWAGPVANLAPTASTTAQATADEPLCSGCAGDQSTINNADINGISIQNSSAGSGDAQALVLALNTTDCFGVKVSWLCIFNEEINDLCVSGLQLQYRIGTSGDWISITGQSKIWSAANYAIDHTDLVASLPAACDNQPVVQLRWFLHQINNNTIGNRFSLSKIHVMPERITGQTGYARAGGNCDSTGANPWLSVYNPAAISAVTSLSGVVSPFEFINNYSGLVNGYSDYTGPEYPVLNVATGDVFDMDVFGNGGAIGTGYTNDQKLVAIYIDWNQDLDFADADEYFPLSTLGAFTDYVGTITVPATAKSGYTRMRVRMVRSDIPMTPTGPSPDGETEDYRVLVDNLLAPLVDCVDKTTYVPKMDSIVCNSTQNLSWGAVTGADGYLLTFIDKTNNVVLIDKDTSLTTSYTLGIPLIPGTTYSWFATAFDANGNAVNCDSSSFKTSPNADPKADVLPAYQNTVCQGQSYLLDGDFYDGTAPYSHNWTGASTGQLSSTTTSSTTFNANTAVGTYKYFYTVKDANNCTAIDSVEIEVLPGAIAGTIDAQSSTICAGKTTVLSVKGGKGKITWQSAGSVSGPWTNTTLTNPGADTLVFNSPVLTTTTSFRAIMYNGICSDTTNEITITVTPAPATPIVTPTSATFCEGQTAVLTVSNFLSDITWNDANSTQANAITVGTSGSYIATATQNGCSTSSDPVVVVVNPTPAKPIVQVIGNNPACDSDILTLRSNSASNNTWNTTETSQDIMVTAGGTFKVTVDNAFGCTNTSDDVVIVFNPQPAKPIITANPSGTICQGQTTVLSSGYSSGNKWSNNSTSNSITVGAAGNYSVTYTDANGCKATSDDFAVVVNPNPAKPTITASGPLCQGTPVNLVSSYSGGGNMWNDNTNSDVLSISANGDYSVTYTDANGCSSTSNVFKATFNSVPATPAVTQTGNTIKTNAIGASYQWYDENGPIAGATAKTFNPTTTGNYFVTVTNAAGCMSDTSAAFYFSGVGINTYNGLDQLSIYPNPSNGSFHVALPENNASSAWMILDLSGRNVAQGNSSGNKIQINENLSKGVYLFKVKTDRSEFIQRIQIN